MPTALSIVPGSAEAQSAWAVGRGSSSGSDNDDGNDDRSCLGATE